MKFIKDEELSILKSIFFFKGQNILPVTILAGFSLADKPELFTEQELWKNIKSGMGKKDVLDLGMPKPLAEILVFGKCFALNGKPVPASKIAFRVGSIQKSLNVFGNRYWKRSNTFLETISEPEPFTEMDIGWSNAFGGEGFELNPDGKGYVELVNKAGIKYQPLPNILYPNGMMGSSKDKPKPAGIAPMGTGWPCRLKKLGTFDKKWLQENWPGFPNDFDFTYFNLAPEDQRKGDYFFGTEEIEINKMHPERPVIKSHLPGIRTRCFVNKKKGNSEVFEELNLKLDTIWLFPHLNMGVCGWRGTTIVVDDESSDVTHLLAFYEKPGETEQPLEYYRSKLLEEEAKAIEPELAEPVVEEEKTVKVKIPGIPKVAGVAGVAVAAGVGAEILKAEPEEEEKEEEEKEEVKIPEPAIEDIAALPPGVKKTLDDLKKNYGIDMAASEQMPGLSKMAPKDALAALEKQIKQDEKKMDEIFRKFGIDPNQPVKDPEMPENIKKIIEQGEIPEDLKGEALADELEKRIELGEQQMDALFHQHGIDPDKPVILPEMLPEKSAEEIIADCKKVGFNNEEFFAELRGMDKELKEIQAELKQYSKQKEEIESSEKEQQKPGESSGLKTDETSEDTEQPESSEQTDKETKETSEEKKQTEKEAEAMQPKFAGKDLSEEDLSKENLQGQDLSGAILENANLSGKNLAGANFSEAILTGAVLNGACLKGAKLIGAKVSKVKCAKADFQDADLTGADFFQADLQQADFSGAVLDRANFSEANMKEAKCNKMRAEHADFTRTDLSNADLSEANLNQADLSKAIIDGATFEKAILTDAWLSDIISEEVNFKEADMTNSRIGGKTSLTNCDFSKAKCEGANWENVDLSGSNFKEADLLNGVLRSCICLKTDFTDVNAKKAEFSKSDLYQAIFRGADIFKGSLRKAKLNQTDFYKANLYSVDFFRAKITGCNFKGANLKKTLIQNWRPE